MPSLVAINPTPASSEADIGDVEMRSERGLSFLRLGSRKRGRNGEWRVKGVIVVAVGTVLRRSLAVGIVEKEERDMADG